MALFGKKKELLDEAQRNVQMAQDQAAQVGANMRASGFDPNEAMRQAEAAMQSGAANDLLAISRRAAQLMTSGIELPATIRTITVGEQSMLTGAGMPVTVGVTVQPPTAVPYEAAAQQVMATELLNQLREGATVTVKVAPDDPQCLMIWGVTGAATAPAPAPPPPPASPSAAGDRVERLTKLQSLRAAGAITDAEFEQQKARILAE